MSETKNKISELQVLVIDDDMLIRVFVQQTLMDLGFCNIDVCSNGQKGWDNICNQLDYYDLIICDWMMPEMNGIELLRKIHAVAPDMPFLMLTVKTTLGDVEKALGLGVSAYVAKPFTGDELQQKVMWLARRILDSDFVHE